MTIKSENINYLLSIAHLDMSFTSFCKVQPCSCFESFGFHLGLTISITNFKGGKKNFSKTYCNRSLDYVKFAVMLLFEKGKKLAVY